MSDMADREKRGCQAHTRGALDLVIVMNVKVR